MREVSCPERAELVVGGARGSCLSCCRTGADDHTPVWQRRREEDVIRETEGALGFPEA